MAVEIGALIVELRANSAQFQAEMDGARKQLGAVGAAGHTGGAGISHLASILTRELIPGLGVSVREMQLLINTARSATGVLGMLGQGGIIVGTAILGYAIGNITANFVELLREGHGVVEAFKLATGQTKSYEERLKAAREEQEKFLEALKKTRAALLASGAALAESRGKGTVLGAQLRGDEPGAARAEYEAALVAIRFQSEARKAALLEATKDLQARKKLEVEEAQRTAQDITNAYSLYAKERKKIEEKATQDQFQLWQKETEFLLSEFQKRVKLRQEFESGLGQGGLGGFSLAAGLGQVGEFQTKLQKDARDLAGLRRLGRVTDKEYFDEVARLQEKTMLTAGSLLDTWQDFPGVERAITNAIQQMTGGYGLLGNAMQDAEKWAAENVDTNEQLAGTWQKALDQFTKVPQATGAAGVAVKKLASDYNDLAWQAAGATQQIYAAAAAMVYFHSVGG